MAGDSIFTLIVVACKRSNPLCRGFLGSDEDRNICVFRENGVCTSYTMLYCAWTHFPKEDRWVPECEVDPVAVSYASVQAFNRCPYCGKKISRRVSTNGIAREACKGKGKELEDSPF